MDPYAVLKKLDDALHSPDGDRQDIYDACEALIDWLRHSGFLPFKPDGHDWRQHLTKAEFSTYLWHMQLVAQMKGEVEK